MKQSNATFAFKQIIPWLIVIGVVVTGYSWQGKAEPEIQEPADFSVSEIKPDLANMTTHWPEITVYGPTGGSGPWPEIPSMKKIVIDYSQVRANTPGDQRLKERVRILFEKNPRQSARDYFAGVDRGEHGYWFDLGMRGLGSFAVHRSNRNGISTLTPSIGLNPPMIADINSDTEAYYAMSVIAHEMMHYEDWKNAKTEEEAAAFVKPYPPMSPQLCERLWHTEHDAYEMQCKMLNQWGMLSRFSGLCDAVENEAAYKQRLFMHLKNSSTGVKKVCIPDYARLAGHPYPAAFIAN